MNELKSVLLVGATGNFGKRLLRNLMRVPGVHVLAGSRNLANAERRVARVKAETGFTHVSAVEFNRDKNAGAQLAVLKPWLVIDASGPFQAADYGFARTVLHADAHYLDLADAADFLMGFSTAVDGLAQERGRVARAGASSTPAISFAVVADHTRGWQRLDTIDIAIVPDGVGDVGENATRGVLTYAGTDVAQFRHGSPWRAKGWLGHEDLFIPGLRRRRVAPVETVDALVMPERFHVTSRVRFLAGLESGLEMGGLQVLAWLRSKGWLRQPGFLAPLLAKGRKLTRVFGRDRGGMSVRMTGLDAHGQWTRSEWSLVASNGCGPHVPGLPAVVATQLLLTDSLQAGARIADDIPLTEIEKAFGDHAIDVQCRSFSGQTPFSGVDISDLPAAVQRFHRLDTAVEWRGVAEVTRGGGLVSRLVGRVMGLPNTQRDVAVSVSLERGDDGSERWIRQFGPATFYSTMTQADDGTVWERFGPFNFALDLQVSDQKLQFPISKGTAFGLPLPRFLMPTSETFETVDAEGRLVFDVKLGLPVFGFLVHYKGWLKPADGT